MSDEPIDAGAAHRSGEGRVGSGREGEVGVRWCYGELQRFQGVCQEGER